MLAYLRVTVRIVRQNTWEWKDTVTHTSVKSCCSTLGTAVWTAYI